MDPRGEDLTPGTRVTHRLSGVTARVKNYSKVTDTLVVEDAAGIMIWRKENVLLTPEIANA